MNEPGYRIEWISPLLLRPYTYNARTHSEEQVAQIVGSIREFGWTNPILIDDENLVIAGHGRLLAAEQLACTSVPCIRLSALDDDQKRAYILADNKLAENAGWDSSMLRLELKDLEEVGFDIGLIGFSADELDSIIRGIDGDGDEQDQKPEFTLSISSADEAEIEALRKFFKLNPRKNKIKARDILSILP